MKNNKGITLTSLVVYIAIVIVVAAVIIRVTTHYQTNLSNVADVSFESEFQKINLYILTESKTVGNGIKEIAENGEEITFNSENKFTYNAEDEAIYLNSNIKICDNVQKCAFEQEIADNGKTMILLTIKINDVEKSASYVLIGKNEGNSINEDDYTFKLGPENYKEVEYIETTGTQYIDTGFIPDNNTSIEMKIVSKGTSNNCLYCARGKNSYNDNTYTAFLIDGTKLRMDYYNLLHANLRTVTNDETYIIKQQKNVMYVNDEIVKTAENITFGSEYKMYLMAAHQGYTNMNIARLKLYYCKIWDDETLIRDYIPCYRESDNMVGLYDKVNKEFYTNAGTGEFIAGNEVPEK